MNDLDAALRATYQVRSHTPEPPDLLDEVLAIPDLDIPQQQRWLSPTTGRLQSMFSATKLVAAGAIVALFGGFLLSGVLTQPSEDRPPVVGASASATTQAEPTEATTSEPEPTQEVEAEDSTTTPDLLPGVDLVTEEVEPGIYRVLSDGIDNDLDFETVEQNGAAVIAGTDGSIWVKDGSILSRLGSEGHILTSELSGWPDISVTPDGTVWAISSLGRVWSSDGDEWTEHRRPGYVRFTGLEVGPDGDVWASLTKSEPEGARLGVARLVDGEWQEEDIGRVLPAGGPDSLALGPDGTMLLGSPNLGGSAGDWIGILEGHEDGWTTAITFDQAPTDRDDGFWGAVGPIAFGRDGTAWAYSQGSPWDGEWPPLYLHQRTDDGWETFGADGSVPLLISGQSYESSLAVSGDGRLWVAFDDPVDATHSHSQGEWTTLDMLDDSACPGLLSYDGEAWTQHLDGACVTYVAAAPDGTVWAAVSELSWDAELDPERPPTGLYVITPEAVQ